MSIRIVSRWKSLVKYDATLASGSSSVRFQIQPLAHLLCTLLPYRDNNVARLPLSVSATPEESVNPKTPLLGQHICYNELISLRFLSLLPPTQLPNRVRTFERSSAHFRAKCTRVLDKIQVSFTLKMVLRPSLTVRKPSNSAGAHFRTKWCAFTSEVVRTFERSK